MSKAEEKTLRKTKRDVLQLKVWSYAPTYLHTDHEMSVFCDDEIFCHLVGENDFNTFMSIMRLAGLKILRRV